MQLSFKGIFMMHLQYFLDAANNPSLTALYAPWIGDQVRAITDNAQASNGDVGQLWSQKGTQSFAPQILGMAISAGNVAVKVCEIKWFLRSIRLYATRYSMEAQTVASHANDFSVYFLD